VIADKGGRPTLPAAGTTSFAAAADLWNGAHPGNWPKSGGTCPACGGSGCFGRARGAPDRWTCFAAGHPDRAPGCGREGDGCWSGDALDLDAFVREIKPSDVLLADGYLIAGGSALASPRRVPRHAAPELRALVLPELRASDMLVSEWTGDGTAWPSLMETRGDPLSLTWSDVQRRLGSPLDLPHPDTAAGLAWQAKLRQSRRRGGESDAEYEEWILWSARKHQLPGWSLASFGGGVRSKATVGRASALMLDLDSDPSKPAPARGEPGLDPDRLRDLLASELRGCAWAAHTSVSSTPESWRWRVIVPLATPVSMPAYTALVNVLRLRMLDRGSIAVEADSCSAESWRLWFEPACAPERDPDHYRVVVALGAPLDGLAVLRELRGSSGCDKDALANRLDVECKVARERVAAGVPPAHARGITDESTASSGPEPNSGVFDRGDPVELGIDLFALLGGPDYIVYDEGEIYAEAGPAWAQQHRLSLERMAHKYAGRYMRGPLTKTGDETVKPIKLTAPAVDGIVKVLQAQAHRPGFFGSAPIGAAFADTFARLDGSRVVIEPLSLSHRVRAEAVAPFRLAGSSALPRTFDALLRDSWAGHDDIEDRIQYLLEWTGAALLGITTRWKDSPFLWGKKDTGKSRIIDAILALFPRATRRHITLHMLGDERHVGRLAGARINAVAEVPARALFDGETAKAVLAGDAVTANPKYKSPFTVVSRCAHIFAANKIPPSLDPALRERFVPLSCPHVVPIERQDRELKARLEEGAPQLASAALVAVERLLRRGHFIRPATAVADSEQWAEDSDPVMAWAREHIEPSETSRIQGDRAYQLFRTWASDNGHKPMAANTFGQRLAALGYQRVRSNGSWWLAQRVGPATVEAEERWGTR